MTCPLRLFTFCGTCGSSFTGANGKLPLSLFHLSSWHTFSSTGSTGCAYLSNVLQGTHLRYCSWPNTHTVKSEKPLVDHFIHFPSFQRFTGVDTILCLAIETSTLLNIQNLTYIYRTKEHLSNIQYLEYAKAPCYQRRRVHKNEQNCL